MAPGGAPRRRENTDRVLAHLRANADTAGISVGADDLPGGSVEAITSLAERLQQAPPRRLPTPRPPMSPPRLRPAHSRS